MPPKKGKGEAKKSKGGATDDIKGEQKRIIDEIHAASDIGEYPLK